MSSEFVRAQIEESLELLASSAADQVMVLEDFTRSFSGEENAPLWYTDQLGSAAQWNEVRRLARVALQLLRGQAE